MQDLDPLSISILKLCRQPQPLKKISKLLYNKYKKKENINSEKAFYHRVYRRVKKLEKAGYLKNITQKDNVYLYATTINGLDLFDSVAKLKPTTNSDPPIRYNISKYRYDAVLFTRKVKMLEEEDRKELMNLFDQYIEDVKEKVIILKTNDVIADFHAITPHYLFLEYETRFTSERRIKYQIWQYNQVWRKCSSRFKRAVHLVLTTDPKRFRSLYDANRHFSKALNRFFSFLKKRIGERPVYLAVYEFTKSGLIHCHLVIFGRAYLIPKHEITREWERCGQGTYNYIYSLKNENGKWVYARERPKDSDPNETAEDYLKKYLIKALFDPTATFLYWVFNKRFYTFAYRIKDWKIIKNPSSGIYEFYGCFYKWDVPYSILQEDNIYLNVVI